MCPPPRWRGHHVVEGQVVGAAGRSTGRCAGRGRRSRAGSSLTRGRGRRIWCWRRITEGARYDLPDGADLGVVVLDDLRLGAEHQPERPRDVADVQGLVVLVQDEHDPVHRPNDSSTAGGVGFGRAGGREPGRGGGAGGDLPSDPAAGPSPARGGRSRLRSGRPRRRPAPTRGRRARTRSAGGAPRRAAPGAPRGSPGSAPRRPSRCRPSILQTCRANCSRRCRRACAADRAGWAAVRRRGRPARPCRAPPGLRAGPSRTSARPRDGPCG